MRYALFAATTLVTMLMGTACQPADQAPAELTAEQIEAIQAISDALERADNAGDWDAVAALYTQDAILLPPNAPAVTGRSAIREFFASLPPINSFNLQVEEIVGRGDLAYVRGTYSMELAPAGAPEPIRDTGKYIEIRRKQADGSWLLSRDIFNSSQPAPGPETAGDTATH